MGSKVDIAFDQAVVVRDSRRTRLLAVDCSDLFADSARLLGPEAVCKLPSPKTLRVVLSSGATLLPSIARTGEVSPAAQRNCSSARVLSLRDGRVKSARDESVSAQGCVRVAAPSNPQPPVAVPLYQRRIGVCDDLSVRAASSVAASGGRPLGFSWAVTFFNGTKKLALPSDFPSLGAAASATVAKRVMPEGATSIRVTLQLRSIFGAVSTTAMEVKRVLDALPAVELSARSSVSKRNGFVVSAAGSIPRCKGGGKASAEPSFVYSWQLWSLGRSSDAESSPGTVVPLGGLLQRGLVRYTNRRKSRLRFAPHALSPCTAYRFRCTVAYSAGEDGSVSNWQTHEVAVARGDIVAIISGEKPKPGTLKPFKPETLKV